MDLTLNVFTLNCWGIPVISKNRQERMVAIATYLSRSHHNIVCLQEIWREKDYLYLKENLRSVYPYSHYFYSGVLGSGLCVFSKWVILDVFFNQWPLNGYIHNIHHGDWFGGKGVGLCRIKHSDKIINVYCTHLHAEYNEDDIYLAHRVLQAYLTAEFVKLTSLSADISILAGDLNTVPGDLAFRLITQLPSLIDPYDMKCQETNPKIKKPSGTCDNINNSYTNKKFAEPAPEGKRIDHILYHVTSSLEAHVLNFGNPLEDRVPEQPFSYSDHQAVTLELQISPTENKLTQRMYSRDERCYETVSEAIKVCKEAMVTLCKSKTLYLTLGSLLFMFLLGTVGFWPSNFFYGVAKIMITGLCFYSLMMGTLWTKMEMNSLKAGLTSLKYFKRCKVESHD